MRLFGLCVTCALLTLLPGAKADECSTVHGNLVSNCGFETGDFSNWSFSGYNLSSTYLDVSHGVDGLDAHSGSYGAYFGGFGGVLDMFQLISTVPGREYEVSYWLAQSPATTSPYVSSFATTFNGVSLFRGGQAPDLAFTHYTFYTLATAAQSLLNFGARDDTGFFSLDDISVVPVTTPEPRSFGLLLAGLGAFLCCSAALKSARLQGD